MFLCDMHVHSGLSRCCKIEYKEVINSAKNAGFNAIVLTNHYAKEYFNNLSTDEFIDKYYEEFLITKEYGKNNGIKVFFGVEITMEFNRKVHLLVYGIGVNDLKKNPYLFNLTIEELYNYCSNNNFVLVQAHPFRGGTTPLDSNFLDGVEINCHPQYGNTYSKELLNLSSDYNLAITCGCDYHGDVSYRPKGGLFLPEEVDDEKKLAYYLKNSKEFNLQVQEINDSNIKKIKINK